MHWVHGWQFSGFTPGSGHRDYFWWGLGTKCSVRDSVQGTAYKLPTILTLQSQCFCLPFHKVWRIQGLWGLSRSSLATRGYWVTEIFLVTMETCCTCKIFSRFQRLGLWYKNTSIFILHVEMINILHWISPVSFSFLGVECNTRPCSLLVFFFRAPIIQFNLYKAKSFLYYLSRPGSF